MQDIKKKRLLVWGGLGLASIIVLGAVAWQTLSSSPAPVIPSKTTPKQIPQAQVKPPKLPTQTPKGETGLAPIAQDLNSPSTLGELTRKRGHERLLKQEVRIRELEKRLQDLSQPSKQELVLPSLTPPPAAPKSSSTPGSAASAPSRRLAVVSVQGIEGRLSATLRMADGHTVTINNGSLFNGGRLHVTRKGVTIHKSGKSSTIPFE